MKVGTSWLEITQFIYLCMAHLGITLSRYVGAVCLMLPSSGSGRIRGWDAFLAMFVL